MHYLSNKRLSKKAIPFFVAYIMVLLYLWGISIVSNEMSQSLEASTHTPETQQEFSDLQSNPKSEKIMKCSASQECFMQEGFMKLRSFMPELPMTQSIQKQEWFLKPVQSETSEPSVMPEQTEDVKEEAELPKVSSLDSRLPAVVYLSIDPNSPTDPLILSEERISETDIEIDISNALRNDWSYSVLAELEKCISRIVIRESESQPMLGQLKVAEGVVSRLRSGIYGSDVSATLKLGYCVETDEAGNFHVYRKDGTEVIDVSEMAMTVTKLALQGANTTQVVLEAATALRNEQFGLELGEEYYKFGAFYHHNPDLLDEKALSSRTINTIPVSYRYVEHVFYGRWLNSAYALNIK